MTNKYLRRDKICLIAWWGALERGGETVGDLYALTAVAETFSLQGFNVKVATRVHYRELDAFDCVNWHQVCSEHVGFFVFVCGPIIGDSLNFREIYQKFSNAMTLAIGVSILPVSSPSHWDPFALTFKRDGEGKAPSLGDFASFSSVKPSEPGKIKTLGLCLRGAQRDYGADNSLHMQVELLVEKAVAHLECDVMIIDTRLHGVVNAASGIVNQFGDIDALITSRMHGALLGLYSGKPTLAIDQIRGGGKVHNVLGHAGWKHTYIISNGQIALEPILEEFMSSAITVKIAECQQTLSSLQRHAWNEVLRHVEGL